MDQNRERAAEHAIAGAGLIGAGSALDAGLHHRLKTKTGSSEGVIWTAMTKPKTLSRKVHLPHLAGKAGVRGMQLAGIPLAVYGTENLIRNKPTRKIEMGRDVLKPVAQHATLRDASQKGEQQLSKYLDPADAKRLDTHRKVGRGLSLTSGTLGLAALGLRTPQAARAVTYQSMKRGKIPAKQVLRLAGKEKKATSLSNTLGIGAIGVGSAGSFNYAAQQRLERKREQVGKSAASEAARRAGRAVRSFKTVNPEGANSTYTKLPDGRWLREKAATGTTHVQDKTVFVHPAYGNQMHPTLKKPYSPLSLAASHDELVHPGGRIGIKVARAEGPSTLHGVPEHHISEHPIEGWHPVEYSLHPDGRVKSYHLGHPVATLTKGSYTGVGKADASYFANPAPLERTSARGQRRRTEASHLAWSAGGSAAAAGGTAAVASRWAGSQHAPALMDAAALHARAKGVPRETVKYYRGMGQKLHEWSAPRRGRLLAAGAGLSAAAAGAHAVARWRRDEVTGMSQDLGRSDAGRRYTELRKDAVTAITLEAGARGAKVLSKMPQEARHRLYRHAAIGGVAGVGVGAGIYGARVNRQYMKERSELRRVGGVSKGLPDKMFHAGRWRRVLGYDHRTKQILLDNHSDPGLPYRVSRGGMKPPQIKQPPNYEQGTLFEKSDRFLHEYGDRISPKAESGYTYLREGRDRYKSEARMQTHQAAGSAAMSGLSGWLTSHEVARGGSKPAIAVAGLSTLASGINAAHSYNSARHANASAKRWDSKMDKIKAKAHERAHAGLYGPGRGKSPVDSTSRAKNLAKVTTMAGSD